MKSINALIRCNTGATIVEFALIAPLFLMLMFGLFELGHTMYIQSVADGAMQEAGRNGTIEGSDLKEIQTNVRKQIRRIAPKAKVRFYRKYNTNYYSMGKLEAYVDLNSDGKCNNGEPFEDLNLNRIRDYTNGTDGSGNARDAVLYRVVVTYDRLFPMPQLAGWSKKNTVVAYTFLRNQPYAQAGNEDVVQTCDGDGSTPPPAPPPPIDDDDDDFGDDDDVGFGDDGDD